MQKKCEISKHTMTRLSLWHRTRAHPSSSVPPPSPCVIIDSFIHHVTRNYKSLCIFTKIFTISNLHHHHHKLLFSSTSISFMDLRFEYKEGYWKNSREMQLFTCKWLPISSSPKALVFLCHGYGMECSRFMKEIGEKLASAGYGVFGMDYEGHGHSAGVRCYITKFDNIVNDCSSFFKSICELQEYKGKAKFLYGESMGGAVSLLLHKKDPSFWDGAVFVAPMCKISEKLKPHPVVVSILTGLVGVIPKWKIVPAKDVINSAFKVQAKREMIRKNKLIYQDKPRLRTALELLRASLSVETVLHEVTLPFLVLHGEEDKVTDPEISKVLYDRASSVDKTMKLYPGMWHGLTSGETDENIELVLGDIISWLDKRAKSKASLEFYLPVPTYKGSNINEFQEGRTRASL
ncbi:caffeoylshikimate esterase-like isoform X2 [Vicia villosa]|uniref:caffeoylshikimate esterase-like isoform X2 n=1 Tax=Vicia villosa TaxID=3911 RepID=UPI00273BEA0F|nr:caffeoylshikimate esterase-like isoform X2 [Vicia villosa]